MPCIRRTEPMHLSQRNRTIQPHTTAKIFPARHSLAHNLRNERCNETSVTSQDTKNAAHYTGAVDTTPSAPEASPLRVFFISIRVIVGLCHGRRSAASGDTVLLFSEVIAVLLSFSFSIFSPPFV